MQQGCDIMPRALSTRVLAASWWFFILILVSSYTANLAAFLTVERMVNPIESAEDLAKQTKIHYGTVKSGSTEAFFKNSNFSTYARMSSFMETTRPSVFVESKSKGIERVKKGDYAFLMESTSIEFLLERECDLYQVGGLLDSKGFGIATPSESPYRALISDSILHLQENGMLAQLKIRWWSEKLGGGTCGPKDGAQKAAGAASELGLANVGGVFVVLALGSLIAIIICISEFIWKMKQIPRTERDHIGVELMRELKHVICCYGSTRPVRKTIDDLTCPIQPSLMGSMNGMAFIPNYTGPPSDMSKTYRVHPPPLTTDSSTQSADPLLDQRSIHSYPEGMLFDDRNRGFRSDSLEEEDLTDSEGGFKPGSHHEFQEGMMPGHPN